LVPSPDQPDALHQKEANFHDQWALSTPVEQIAVRAAFESPTAMENQFILQKMGDLRAKKLLDIGAGLGESSVYFALQGAQVTATDLSPAMIACACKLAQHHGATIRGIVTPGETLAVGDNEFDLVYVANTIHHVKDKLALFAQIHRVLRPGGRFFSFDPLAYNPLINIYRRMATQVRTEDESPLRFSDVNLARKHFVDVGHREFWIASLALFAKYFLIDRVHPNADRYWKRIYEEDPRSLRWWKPLRAADRVLTRLPLARALAWNMVMWGKKRE
jgi:SAM-dependent methyltransferase